ncbi:MAG: ferrochelatase [Thaumarchaeota archaeon]|nr:ferrochelatase [Nitrososphaerota archaeon]
MGEKKICVVLMTYGSPATLDDIPTYLKRVRGGREPDEALVAEFRRRYQLIGGSPLLRITGDQAACLETELNGSGDDHGLRYRVVAGMRFSPPLIADVVLESASDADHLVGVIMSPQYSPTIMGGYVQSLQRAVAGLGRRGELELRISEDWHLQPFFLRALAERVEQALGRFPPEVRGRVPVLLTAHSMPKRVVEDEPGYVDDLRGTAAAVAEMVGLPKDRWMFCYQSAGHTPEEWLKPDFADVMPELRDAGYRQVLVAPVQFLADHLEVLYDIEIGARGQAEAVGMQFNRIESLNTSPLFIKGLSAVVHETMAKAPLSSR